MLDDFDNHAPPWRSATGGVGVLKSRGFFAHDHQSKAYGGCQFSAYAHSCVLVKLASRSVTCAFHRRGAQLARSGRAAEPLRHRRTEEPLPAGLARGIDIPCFASPDRAWIDAASIPDTGIVCRGQWQGHEVLGCASISPSAISRWRPCATLIGLAFRMFDPDRLLGGEADLASPARSCSATRRESRIGTRHFPLNIPVPERSGAAPRRVRAADLHHRRPEDGRQGWRMAGRAALGGRCISLPSNATGGARPPSTPAAPTCAFAASSNMRSASSRASSR